MSNLSVARRNRVRRALLETLEQRTLMAVDLGFDSALGAYCASQTRTPMGEQLEFIQSSLHDAAASDSAAYLSSTLGQSSGSVSAQPWFPLVNQAYDQWSRENDLAYSLSTSDSLVGNALRGEGEMVAEGEAGGPRLLSVAPNSGEIFSFNNVNTLTEAPTELVFRFDGSSGISQATIQNGIKITRAGHDGIFDNGTPAEELKNTITGKALFGDNNRIVIVRFAETLPNDLYRVEVLGADSAPSTAIRNTANLRLQTRLGNTDRDTINFKLELGAQVVAVVPQPVDRVGGVLTPRLNQIDVYFNDDDLYPVAVTTGGVSPNPTVVDPNFYQLVFTNDSVQPNDDQRFVPTSIAYDPIDNRATLTFTSRVDQLGGSGTYRLRVGTNDVVTSTVNPPVVTTMTPPDAGSTAATANSNIGTLSGAVPTAIVIHGQVVSTTPLLLDYPGSNFEPGHRDLPSNEESHIATARLPFPGGGGSPDANSQITTAFFNFAENSQGVRRSYGTNAAGQPVFTSITPEQKERIREIYEFYSAYLGIDFVESEASGMTIVVGDLFPSGEVSGGGTLGVASVNSLSGLAIMDGAQVWDNGLGQPISGASFFQTAMHEIGHMLGLGHDTELPDGTIQRGSGPGSPLDGVYPGDQDVVHGQYLYRPDNRDTDLYRFVVPVNVTGEVSLEIIAERAADSSNLDSHLTLFRETASGKLEVVAANDDYFSSDSFIKTSLKAGTYFVGVTTSGNQDFNPLSSDSGGGGVSQGSYQLQFQFLPNFESSIVDTSGTRLDGDGDGRAGGNFNFWFRAAPPTDVAPAGMPKTVYVDKDYSGVQTGSATQPFNNLPAAASAVGFGDILRVVGSVGADGDLTTVLDNEAYEIGRGGVGNAALSDGITFEVPQGVTMMIDAGAIFKLGGSRIVAGSRDAGIDNRFSSVQVLGTPIQKVLFTSYNDQALGTDTNPLSTTPQAGDWGGIEIHNDVDRNEGRGDYERKGIFLNYISHADMKYGGGRITVATPSQTINPIHLSEARPTLLYNTISKSGDSAISADPDSFEETRFSEPRYQLASRFRADYTRVGPDIRGNVLVENPINGLFIRVQTSAGNVLKTLGVQAHLDDRDIVYVLGENLVISGTSGGSFFETLAPDVSLVQTNVTSNSAPGTTVTYKLTYVDRFGGEGVPSSPTPGVVVPSRTVTADSATDRITSVGHGFVNNDSVNIASSSSLPDGLLKGTNYFVVGVTATTFQLARTLGGTAINFSSNGTGTLTVRSSVRLSGLPQAFGDFVTRRLWRSDNGGAYQLVAELDRNTPNFTDAGQNLATTLASPNATSITRARTDARLQVDPGVIVKSLNSRIEVGIGAQLLAEGTPANKIIFTSRFDDRFGAGGTFDTNNDGNTNPGAGNWGGIVARQLSSLSIDSAVISYAGGLTSVPGGFAGFNAVEIHQSTARIANSIFENNTSGTGGSLDQSRDGRGNHDAAVIFVRGSQPTIINNVIQHNAVSNTAAISVDANSMKAVSLQDPGRQTGVTDRLPGALANNGPLVRGNRLLDNGLNAMRIRGATLTTEAVWDDTDIVHVLQSDVVVPDFHTYGGLRLQSRVDESLVVKLGAGARITATGVPLDITNRIGGSLQVIGAPGFPVVMTSIKDDTVGAGFDPTGKALLDTGNDGSTAFTLTDAWRGVRLDQFSNDRNLDTTTELESDQIQDVGVNDEPLTAQSIGSLAAGLIGGDENLRLGFTIHGAVASPSDLDVYSFVGTAGVPVYFDLDRTDAALDSVVELIDSSGRIIAQSNNSLTESIGGSPSFIDSSLIAADKVQILETNSFAPKNSRTGTTAVDFQSTNPNDAGLRVVLPGAVGTTNTYFVRVRSSNIGSGQAAARLQDPALLRSGLSEGGYRLQVRMQQTDEIAGSAIRYADIRYAINGIEAIGLPAHSPLLGRSSAPQGNSIYVPTDSTNIGNINTSDRASISVAGNLSGVRDVDYYQFSIGRNLTQQSSTTHVATTFDIDYASDFGGPNTSMWVYRVTPAGLQLILTGTDSNIADDRSAPGQGADLDNLSRGSFGALDSYIGTQELPAGNYVVAISNNSVIASQLKQFQTANPGLGLLAAGADVRLEPIDSIQRISVDRFELANQQETALAPKQVAFSGNANNIPWTLGDVTAYVVHGNPANGSDSRLVLGDAYTGAHEATVGTLPRVGDAAMSPDGRLVGYQLPNGLQVDANSGVFLNIDSTGSGATAAAGNAGIQTFTTEMVGNNVTVQPRSYGGASQGEGIQFNALSFYDASGSLQMYGVGSRGNSETSFRENDNDPNTLGFSVRNYNATNILYRLDPNNGNVINAGGVIDRTGNFRTNGNHAGTQKVEYGRFLSGTSANNYLDGGTVTGLTYVGGRLFAVSNKGELFSAQISSATNEFLGQSSVNFVDVNGDVSRQRGKTADLLINDPATNLPIAFTSLTTGPRNVNSGAYAQMLFGTTGDGTIYAFDTAGVLQNVFPGGNYKVKSSSAPLDRDTAGSSSGSVVGIAFSPLDVNLWHMTNTQGNAAGHGRPATFDDSRTASQAGENSMYFGFESPNRAGGTQSGNWTGIFDVSAYRNTYNLPGGAHGAMESQTVDLRGFSSTDLPTLYFNYYLNTQNSNSANNDGDVQMQDAFRVYAAGDDGQWKLITTNNSAKSGDYNDGNDEYDQNISRYADPYSKPLQPQEAYDTGDAGAPDAWRQVRASLAPFAGQQNVRIRFEFSTAGSFATDDALRGGVELTTVAGTRLKDGDTFTVASTDITPSKAATFEFDLGLVLDLPGGASLRDGDSININGTVYTFSTTSNTGNNILFAPSSTAAGIASAVRIKLLAAGGFNVATNPVRTNVLNISGSSAPAGGTYSVSGLPASTIAGVPGVSFLNVAVPVTQDMTSVQVRTVVTTALASALNVTGQSTNTDVWPGYNSTIRMYKHVVTNRGPLLMSSRIGDPPGRVGDTFGADVAAGTTYTSAARQAQNNAFTGVFIDDIIIGLAERGEMVLNAQPVAVGSNNDQNQLLFANNAQYRQNGFTVGGQPLNEVEAGRYQLEIRTSAEYGDDEGGKATLLDLSALSRSFTSNDRMTPAIGFDVNASGASIVSDGASFTLSDGINQVQFEFDVFQSTSDRAVGITPGNIRIALFASDTAQQVATKIRDAINGTTAQSLLGISASIEGEMLNSPTTDRAQSGSQRVLLHGPASMTRTGGVTLAANTGLTLKTWGVDTVFGEDGGDINRKRDQGMLVISSSSFSNSTQFGISVDASTRAPGAPTFPGAPMNYPTVNTAGLAPGVVIVNNILANNTQGGIFVSGDAQQNKAATGQDVLRASTIARILNNTIYGRLNGDTAIRANDGAAPQILNNIIANTSTGINVTGTSASLVIGANLYFNVPAGSQLIPAGTPQTFAVQTTTSPFINANGGFFYPAPGSLAIDSSLEALAELAALTQVKSTIGLPPSPVLAPDRDALGQRRVDDPTVNDSSGVGSNVFKDRGAVERADVTALQAVILKPQDNDSSNVDIDRNDTFVRLQSGLLDYFSILLVDGEGTGADQSTVTENAVTLTENGRRLLPNIDYVFGYNANSRTIRLTPLAGIWRSDSVYEITMNNRDGIRVTTAAGSALVDNDRLTITLPDNTQRILTFRNAAIGNLTIPFTSASTPYQVAAQTVAQINALGQSLGNGLSAYLQGDGSLMVVGAKSISVSNAASANVRPVSAIRDLATNPLAANRATSLTQFTIVMPDVQLDYGDANGAGSFTMQTANGARHALLPIDVPLLALGRIVDVDGNGSASSSATGDDNDSLVNFGTLGSVGGVVQGVAGPATYALPAVATAGLYGQTISITSPGLDPGVDPIIKKQVYEFTSTGSVAAGNVPVIVALGATVADKFASAVNYSVQTGKLVGLAAVATGAQVSLGGSALHKFSASATPLIQRLAVGNVDLVVPTNVSALADGQFFTITDGNGQSVTFEINDTSPPGPISAPVAPLVTVNIPLATATSATAATAIGNAIAAQIVARRLNLAPVVVTGSTVSILANDEDGVVFGKNSAVNRLPLLFNTNSAPVPITVTATGSGMLDAWVDWNGDGDFNDAGEQFVVNQPVQAGANTFTLQTPASAAIGFTTARFRLSALGSLLPGGLAIGGEVEDHLIEVVAGFPPTPKNDHVYVREDSRPTGTATVANATTLGDSSQNWAVDQWVGLNVRIVSGTGAGQSRSVVSNTSTALTTAAWTVLPDSTSVYAIEFKSILANDVDPETGTVSSATSTTLVDSTQTWNVGQWVGQNVTIVSGTGAGQTRSVTGNTANTLTISAWTTLPDTTSRYSIDRVGAAPNGGLTVLDLDLDTEGTQTVTTTANGTIRLNSNGTFSYTPNAEFFGDDAFVYQAIDARLQSVPATVTITVTPVNDAPKAFDKTATILEENSATSVVTNYVLPGSFFWTDALKHQLAPSQTQQYGEGTQTLKLTAATLIDASGAPIVNAAIGSVSVTADEFTFVPGSNYNSLVAGDIRIRFTIDDDGITTDNNLVDQPDFKSATATFVISVTPVNDRPEFPAAYLTNLSTTTVEDAGVVTVPNFIVGVRPGPVNAFDEGSASQASAAGGSALQYENQTIVAFEVNAIVNGVRDSSLFAVPPAIAPDGTLTYRLADDVNETLAIPGFPKIEVEVVAVDSGSAVAPNVNKSLPITFTIKPTAVNDAPVFDFKPAAPSVTVTGQTATVSVLEDAGLVTIPTFLENYRNGPATALDEDSQALQSISITLMNPPGTPVPAFTVAPTIDLATFNLTFQTAPQVNNNFATGSFVFTVTLTDNGPTGGLNINSTTKTFTISVAPVNDRPEFTMPASTVTSEDAGLVTTTFITAIRPGPVLALDEANGPAVVTEGQMVSFQASALNASLFTVPPTIAADGSLSYQLAPNVNEILANGSTPGFAQILVEVIATDTGAATSTNLNSSLPVTFTILPTAINDGPEFTLPVADVVANEDAGLVTVPGFMTSFRPGPVSALDEASQTLTVSVGASGNAFTVMPSINLTNGDLTFRTAPDVNRSTGHDLVVYVTLTDSGSGLAPNVNSTTKSFTLNITPVNDKPLFTLPAASVTVFEDNESFIGQPKTQIAGFAIPIAAGPATALDEVGVQSLNFTTVSVTNASLFSVAPTMTSTGTLEFVTAKDQNGTSVVVVHLGDNGASTAPDENMSADQTFTIVLQAVNDAPEITLPATVTGREDQGLVTIAGFASNLRPGPLTALDEIDQTFTVNVVAMDTLAFSVQPTIGADGTLRYQTAADVNSNFTVRDLRVKVQLVDEGTPGPLPDTDRSVMQTFTVITTAVNDAPGFTLPQTTITVIEDSEAFQVPAVSLTTIPGFATNITTGPATALDEASQIPTFEIINVSAPELFSVAPTVSSTGVLSFATASNKNGKAVVILRVVDSGPPVAPNISASDRQTFTISITPVNDAPLFDVPLTFTVNEDQGLVTKSGFATNVRRGPVGTDDENSQTVLFHVEAVNQAAFEIQPSIGVDGTLRFKTAANANSENSNLAVRVYLTDSGLNSPAPNSNTSVEKTFTIIVNSENDAPIADALTIGGTEDETQTISATIILDGDVAGPTSDELEQDLIITQVERTTALGGTVTPVFTGSAITSLIYRPAANAVGLDTFLYVVTDNGAPNRSGTGTITITLAAVNDPPQFVKGADQAVLEDSEAVAINGWATGILAGPPSALDELASQTVRFDVIADNSSLFAEQPAVSSAGVLSFKLAVDAVGSATVTVQAVDNGLSPNASRSAISTFTITVTPVNDAPVFTAGTTVNVNEDSGAYSQTWATQIKPAAGLLSQPQTALDEIGQVVDFILTLPPGAASLFAVAPSMSSAGLLTFTPASNAFGTVLISVVAKDRGPAGTNDKNTSVAQTLTIAIASQNDAPQAVPDNFTTSETVVFNLNAPGLLSNDIDVDLPDDTVRVLPATLTSALGASVIIRADGSIAYDPTNVQAIRRLTTGQSVADTFVYKIRDSAGAISNEATVTILVNGFDDAPVAKPDVFTVAVGVTQQLDVLANDTDVDTQIDPRTIVLASLPAFGTAVVNQAGLVTYTPGIGFRGTDTFSYTVKDVGGHVSNEATVSVIVNNAPKANGDSAFTLKNEAILIDVLANDSDPDGTLNRSSVEIVGLPSPSGTAVVQSDGKVLFTPAPNYFGNVQFSYFVRDDVGTPSNVADVQVRVNRSKWQNPALNLDVNADGQISPIDALMVINYLNVGKPASLSGSSITAPPFVDPSGDESVTALDVLQIINYLNTHLSGEGEPSPVIAEQLGAPLIVTMVTPEQMVRTVGASVVRSVEAAIMAELEACGPWSSSSADETLDAADGAWSEDDGQAALTDISRRRQRLDSAVAADNFFASL